MDVNSLLAGGVFAAIVYKFASSLARFLVRFRASLLPQGGDADRLRDEWKAVLWELGSRREQLLFAVGLFKNFQKLQTATDYRSNESIDFDNRVEQRVLEEVHRVRAEVETEGRMRRELLEKDRIQLDLENAARRKQLDAERDNVARVLAGLKGSTQPRVEDLKKLEAWDAVHNLERAVMEAFVATQPLPESPEIAKKLVRALEQHISVTSETSAYHPVYRAEGESEDYNDDYGIHENQRTWQENPFREEGILLFSALSAQQERDCHDDSHRVSVGLYALTTGTILECVSEEYEYHSHGTWGWWSDSRGVRRTGQEYSLDDFVARISQSQKTQILLALVNNEQTLRGKWEPIHVHERSTDSPSESPPPTP